MNIDKIVRCLCKSKCFISFLDMKIKYINTHKIVIASQHFSKMKHFDYACCNVNEIVTDINMHINKVIKYLKHNSLLILTQCTISGLFQQ